MKEVKFVSNGGTGALVLSREPITGREIISLGLNERHDVLALQKALNDYINKNYN